MVSVEVKHHVYPFCAHCCWLSTQSTQTGLRSSSFLMIISLKHNWINCWGEKEGKNPITTLLSRAKKKRKTKLLFSQNYLAEPWQSRAGTELLLILSGTIMITPPLQLHPQWLHFQSVWVQLLRFAWCQEFCLSGHLYNPNILRRAAVINDVCHRQLKIKTQFLLYS